MKSNNICGGRTFRTAAGITVLVLLLLVGGAGAVSITTIWDEESGSPLPFTWNFTNFDGFNVSGIGTENLTIVQTNLGAASEKTRTIRNWWDDPSGEGLMYNTTKYLVEYGVSKNESLSVEHALDSAGNNVNKGNYYAKVNLFGEPYIALNGKANKLTKLVLEQRSNEPKILTVGETWDLGEGWELTAQSIDARATPRQVWLVLSKDGVTLDDAIIEQGKVYTYLQNNLKDELDVPVFVTYIDNVFNGTTTDFVIFKYTWLISKTVTEVSAGDISGLLEVISSSSNEIEFVNKDTNISLEPNTTRDLAGNIKFKVTDNATYLKFYPAIEPRLNITASSVSIPAGTPTDVIFTVTSNGSPINGATVSLSGAAVGSGITGTDGQANININAAYNGTIIAEAGKAGYTNATTTMQAHLLPIAAMASWNLQEDYILNLIDIDARATPRQARLQLSKNGIVIKDSMVTPGNVFEYCPSYNCTFNATVDVIFNGTQGNLVRLINASQYSESTGNLLPINETHLFKSTDFTGISWVVDEGYELRMMDMDTIAVPRLVWLELLKNDTIIDDAIVFGGESYYYNNSSGSTILTAKVDGIFKGIQGNLVKLADVTQYSESTGNPLFINKTHLFKSTDFTGISWELYEGYELRMMDMDVYATPRLVWLELLKNDTIIDDSILYWGQSYYYNNSSGSTILTAKVDGIFNGETASIVKLKEVTQYSETSEEVLLDNSTHSFIPGIISRTDKPLEEDYTIALLGTDIKAVPRMAWLRLYRNNTMVDEKLAMLGDIWYYNLSNKSILYAEVNSIFAGETANIVQLKNVTQFSEMDGSILISGNYTLTINVLPTPTPTESPTPTTTSPPSGGGGGSSGGGGGGASGENYANIEIKEKYDLHIFKDKTTSYKFTSKNSPILFVNITGNINAGEITTVVEVLRNTSSLVKTPPQGVIYKNMNIWVGTSGFAVPKNIKEAVVGFAVQNSWLNNSELKSNDIKLVRWDGSRWVALETVETSSDSTYTYYEAKTDSLSAFAITGLRDAITPTATPSEANMTQVKVAPTQTEDQTKRAAGFDIVLAITTLSAVYKLRQRRR